MTDVLNLQERKRRDRRASVGLHAVETTTRFTKELLDLAILLTKGGFDGQEALDQLYAAKAKFDAEFAQATEQVESMVFAETVKESATTHEYDKWLEGVRSHRARRKQQARIAERRDRTIF